MTTALLFTDIEGSTRMVEQAPAAYALTLKQHHAIIREITAGEGGMECQEAGDGFFLAFPGIEAAERAAVAMQEAFRAASWPEETGPPRVRMALHWAEAEFRDGQYRGPAVHLTARLLAAGHGGQILCSREAAGRVAKTRRLGTFRLRGFEKDAEIHQIGDGPFPPLHVAQARRHNLPAMQDDFVGRGEELDALVGRLAPASPARLITLSGAGGIGKTRLAVAAARRLLDAYEHGVLYVPLVEITDATMILGAILSAAGARMENTHTAHGQVVELLSERPTLLVFDNFEHLAAEGATLIARLHLDLPAAHFLITSRARLGLAGEQEMPVHPFRVPPEEADADALGTYDCVRLFVERAAKARPGFDLTTETAPAIGGLCRLLDGMPLTIELAAARLQVLTTGELLEALQRDLSEISTDRRLEGVFAWSCRLLPPDIAGFLGALGVFRGGWTAPVAAAVGGLPDVSLALAYLHYLLTCSLIRAAENAGGMRFAMLEPIRQLAEAREPARRAEAAGRHGTYFFALARRVNTEFRTEREETLAREIEPETANILAALEREPENQRRIFSAVDFHQFALGRSCNRKVRALLTEHRPDGGEVNAKTLARAWTAAGVLDHVAADWEGAEDALGRAIPLFEELEEHDNVIRVRVNLASIARECGRHQQAYDIYGQALDFFRERGAHQECAVILSNQGSLAQQLGHRETARALLEESLVLCRKAGDTGIEASALSDLGEIWLAQGDAAMACAYMTESLSVFCRRGASSLLPHVLSVLGRIAFVRDDAQKGAFFGSAANARAQRQGFGTSAATTRAIAELVRDCRDALTEEDFLQETARGEKAKPSHWLQAARTIFPDEAKNFSQSGAVCA